MSAGGQRTAGSWPTSRSRSYDCRTGCGPETSLSPWPARRSSAGSPTPRSTTPVSTRGSAEQPRLGAACLRRLSIDNGALRVTSRSSRVECLVVVRGSVAQVLCSASPAHTVAVGILIRDNRALLALRSADRRAHPARWTCLEATSRPASLPDALRRELYEEFGVEGLDCEMNPPSGCTSCSVHPTPSST
ncbi:NUDIX domain-containing protein [Kineococcus sp. SYSU DK003]|uniref:NUDIX domain-containing protein n=1 Tax=Kineococcus sp. SYSU DK003 TaxID=3383124 RepID=UPI003D7EAEB0